MGTLRSRYAAQNAKTDRAHLRACIAAGVQGAATVVFGATARSWELFARYVIPEVKGLTKGLQQSFQQCVDDRETLMTQQIAALKKANEDV